jgi:phosphonate transport system substrate-binding protein
MSKKVGSHKLLKAILMLTAVSLIGLAVSNTGASASATPQIKDGETCSATQYGKLSGKLRCAYKNKKYQWATVVVTKAPAAVVSTDKTGWPTKFIVGAVPSENAASMTIKYQNFVTALSRELGIPVEFQSATDYAGIIEAQVAGRVDLAFYGPFSYILAKARGAKIDSIGAAILTKTATPGYRSYGVTAGSNAAITKLGDFRGKKVCFVDPASTSGFLYPTAGLLAEGLKSGTDYTATYAGGHDASALSVAKGTCDVGFAYDEIIDTALIAKGDLKAGDLKIVWKSGLIPGSPMAVRVDMPKTLVAAVTKFVIEKANKPYFVATGICKDEATCQIIEDKSWGFTKVTDSYYDAVRQVCEATKSSKCK